ncbi:exopolysaccharide biosynthesis polyprenyl glycosylphosphotransferase [Tenacibaculum sp. M341]|uniref:exopolysaccharide biosynthesis polyprenyl glycosylphosphotransferase n=1 Tax=Tenacibaculum sp. M341 TaxID=2530339 RepID=UPI001FB41891|nr:exopolysaccharide biosynthesis polyprenyl glycosylphosphotransferase [Tenacibaculum sp. M341]
MLIIDLFLINLSLIILKDKEYLITEFLVYINLFWIVSSLITSFYKIYRHHNYFKILSLLVGQLLLFMLGFFTFFSLFREGDVVHNQTKVLVTIIVTISITHIIFFYLLKKYRSYGKNYRKVVVLGFDESTVELTDMFKNDKELGYQFLGFFSDKKNDTANFLGSLKQYENYVLNNNVDEIYCSLTELKNKQIKKIKKFAIRHKRKVKLIPNANELYNKNTVTEFYGDSLVVLNVKQLPFELIENRIIKRIFDVFFSILVCVFIISWLYPILWILIKLESKGPVIFKQEREGFNGKKFVCYKFRSMRINAEANQVHTTKNDQRITKTGAFIRKTSIDEIPQFFNVLFGSMSVVGPRPHLESLALEYQKDVDNYLERYAVKPGITGLAQISGYRGEIRKKSDIKNRVRLDIFYIENWSFLLDIKIIINTILNVFKGDENAY